MAEESTNKFTIELAACEFTIESHIKAGATQKQIAEIYAMAIVSSWPTDWARVNNAIRERWPKGLDRVKTMAWKIIEAEQKRRKSHETN